MLPYYELCWRGVNYNDDTTIQKFDVYQYADDFSLVAVDAVYANYSTRSSAYNYFRSTYPGLPLEMIPYDFAPGNVRIIADHALIALSRYSTNDIPSCLFSSGRHGSYVTRHYEQLQTQTFDNGASRLDFIVDYIFDFGYVREEGYEYYDTEGALRTIEHNHTVVVEKHPTDCCLRVLCYPNDYFYEEV